VALGGQFRRLWVASALSNLADGVFQVALPLLAVTLTKSPALVAGVALAQRLPWLVMALPAGALADRLDRRRTMVRVDALRVIVMGALAAAVGLDAASMPVLYAAAVVLGVGETLFDTAAQSILPSLVDRSQLSAANGRLQAVELTANQFVGPPLGGVLAAAAVGGFDPTTSQSYLLATSAATFLGTAILQPGRFNPLGTWIAVYFLATGILGLNLLGFTGWVTSVFYGGVLVIAVTISTLLHRRAG